MNIENFRNEFESPKRGSVFLNHAGTSPLPARCAEAMKRVIDLNRTLMPDEWVEIENRLASSRQALSRLLNVSPEEVAFSRNTTEGINWVANGIDWHPNDRIVTIHGEYPANIYPWMRLRRRGVILHLIQPENHRVTLEQIDAALIPRTRLLALSFVEFASGYRFDLEAVGELCRDKGVLLLVDVIQGAGVFPLDLKKFGVTFAAGGGQKWLLGPQGSGFFYCAKDNLDMLTVSCVGSDSMARPLPYLLYEYVLRPDTLRFEYATPAAIPLIGMGASVEMLLEAGIDAIGNRIRRLTDFLVEGAVRKGYHCHSPRGAGEWSGIVAVSHPKESNQSVLVKLNSNKIFAIEREGAIRFSPHFYQTEDEMQRVVDTL